MVLQNPILLLQVVIVVFSAALGSAQIDVLSATEAGSLENGQLRSSKSESSSYIVMLRHAPVASYTGGTDGMVATAAAAGEKLDVTTAAAVAYAQYVDAQSATIAQRAGVMDKVIHKYQYVAAGFATGRLTSQQLQTLESDPDVAFVAEARAYQLHTLSTPRFLGLNGGKPSGAGGVWRRFGGSGKGGDNVVIGVVDTGLWPEHEEFSDRRGFDASADFVYPPDKAGYSGTCQGGHNFSANTCNRKLIGCNYFYKGYVAANNGSIPGWPLSCSDTEGHGTHTAATAAGNFGAPFVDGTLSGVAPHARIVVYKVFWQEHGYDVDIIAALDHAAQSGIDIINFSLGSVAQQFPDAVNLALLRVAQAGILVSASAGNSGPNYGTVDNVDPWVLTVAASTHDRQTNGVATLGTGDAYTGAAWWWNLNLKVPRVSGRLVLGNDAALAGQKTDDARLCIADSLDPVAVEGKIVVCDRGQNARAAKSAEVKRAGGIGMILLNTNATEEVICDSHSVPTVHLLQQYRNAVRTYAANVSARATLEQLPITYDALAPQMAGFSSRGPEPVRGGTVLKPDVTAPGVDILAASSPLGSGYHAVMSGTSMSAPHVAGLAALLRQQYPTWSPMAIKSALMTTAYQTTSTGTPGQAFGTPLDYGAGHVDAKKMLFPGLVFDSSFADWAYYTCGAVKSASELAKLPDDIAKYCRQCDALPDKCDPANLNMPSISIPDIKAGHEKTVYRTVKNVLNGAATFTATSEVGSSGKLEIVSIIPNKFMLGRGSTQKIAVTVRATVAAKDEMQNAGFVFGSITWTSDKTTVSRIPVAVKALATAG